MSKTNPFTVRLGEKQKSEKNRTMQMFVYNYSLQEPSRLLYSKRLNDLFNGMIFQHTHKVRVEGKLYL